MRDIHSIVAVVALGSLLLTACGDGNNGVEPAGGAPAALTPLAGDELLGVSQDWRIHVFKESGALVRTLGTVPHEEGAEVNAVDVSPDGARALVSVQNDHDEVCSATVYEATDSGLRPLFDGAAASFSPDGHRIAHLSYTARGEFCFRSGLSIRNAEDGVVLSASALPGGETLEDTPPTWPVNWSPDGMRLVFLGAKGKFGRAPLIVEVRPDGRLGAARPPAGGSLFSPVFTRDLSLLGADDCCIRQQLVARDPQTGRTQQLAPLDSPIRSARADRGGEGAWFLTELGNLFHWNGGALTPVQTAVGPVVMASG